MAVTMPDGARGYIADTAYWSMELGQWRCHVWPNYPLDWEKPWTDWVSLNCDDVVPLNMLENAL
jgi:hypothetical protein